jgi:hypothetical protein
MAQIMENNRVILNYVPRFPDLKASLRAAKHKTETFRLMVLPKQSNANSFYI